MRNYSIELYICAQHVDKFFVPRSFEGASLEEAIEYSRKWGQNLLSVLGDDEVWLEIYVKEEGRYLSHKEVLHFSE